MKLVALKTDKTNLTDEQFFNLCVDNSDLRIERDKHLNIIIMSPTTSRTSNYNFKIASRLEIWNEKEKLGFGFDSNGGFTLADKSILNPDAAWITNERYDLLPENEKDTFAHICPDFVIEIRSKSDTLKEQQEKMECWMDNGCRLGWLIDPIGRNSYIYKPKNQPTIIPFKETLSGEDVLPGFELKLEEVIPK